MDIDLNGNRCEGIYAAMDIGEIKPVKVIMLTSVTGDDIILDSFTAGAVDYVNKENYKEIPLIMKRAFCAPTYTNTLINEFSRQFKGTHQ
ncbi:hypothetical protein Bccel_3067 [Pseudobacteroides cellulosolvens ATCC 35603 = DSM 2933]|uniref:Stage 0 sporulation protein A homolog n=2 Tax=Pseudobacteroides cellulosolvens TaxID=35825 RepID=A0A0L6JPN3_9FIRM|nr:hypothetical protein Bccel_3067 [Pseudobacteroides cellulosolvens ATCC 35603 = DSM 2933]